MKPTYTTNTKTYFGGKGAAGVVHQIINQLPRHDVFVSGFAGNCAVLRYKLPARHQLAIDLDADMLAQWEQAGVETECEDFLLYLGRWQSRRHVGATTLFYLDPPYLLSTRSDGRPRYKYEACTDEWHQRFLEAVLRSESDALFCISCYDSPLYAETLQHWRKVQFSARTQRYTATETLYMNYAAPEPHQLHDPRYLGGTFRDRERIKRRVASIAKKIECLPAADQYRVLAELQQRFFAHL